VEEENNHGYIRGAQSPSQYTHGIGQIRRYVCQDGSTIELVSDGIDAYIRFTSPSGKNVQDVSVGWFKSADKDVYKEG
jgi:hypothetical protein